MALRSKVARRGARSVWRALGRWVRGVEHRADPRPPPRRKWDVLSSRNPDRGVVVVGLMRACGRGRRPTSASPSSPRRAGRATRHRPSRRAGPSPAHARSRRPTPHPLRSPGARRRGARLNRRVASPWRSASPGPCGGHGPAPAERSWGPLGCSKATPAGTPCRRWRAATRDGSRRLRPGLERRAADADCAAAERLERRDTAEHRALPTRGPPSGATIAGATESWTPRHVRVPRRSGGSRTSSTGAHAVGAFHRCSGPRARRATGGTEIKGP
jgi:hypothetical protein